MGQLFIWWTIFAVPFRDGWSDWISKKCISSQVENGAGCPPYNDSTETTVKCTESFPTIGLKDGIKRSPKAGWGVIHCWSLQSCFGLSSLFESIVHKDGSWRNEIVVSRNNGYQLHISNNTWFSYCVEWMSTDPTNDACSCRPQHVMQLRCLQWRGVWGIIWTHSCIDMAFLLLWWFSEYSVLAWSQSCCCLLSAGD